MAANRFVSKTNNAGSSPALPAAALVAQLEARHDSNVTVVGSTPAESACVPVAQLDRVLPCEGKDGSSTLPGNSGVETDMVCRTCLLNSVVRKPVQVRLLPAPLLASLAQSGQSAWL